MKIILTCEHASNRVPPDMRIHFRKEMLTSHRGWDEGAGHLARKLRKLLKVPLFEGKYSRLLVDLNRSVAHPKLHSAKIRKLSKDTRRMLIQNYYVPFRKEVVSSIQTRGGAFHFSIHSFVPILDGITRNNDIGLLYDPKRVLESTIAKSIKRNLEAQIPEIRVRMNYPYRGSSDGHTTSLRKHFGGRIYSGIEIEINQNYFRTNGTKLPRVLAAAIRSACNSLD